MHSVTALLHNLGITDRWVAWSFLAVGLVLVVVEAALAVQFADTIYDEGGYLYEGWLAVARGWVPYRDFHTKVTPLIYYFYGLPQAVVGPGVSLGRHQAAAGSLVGLALCCWALARRYGLWAVVVAVFAFAAVPAGLDQHFRALAVAPIALWVSLGLLGVSLQPGKLGVLLAGVAAGLVFLTRQDVTGLAVGLVVGTGLASRSWRAMGWAALWAVAVALVGLAPFVLRPTPQLWSVISLGLVSGGDELGVGPFARTEPLTLANLPWYAAFLGRAYAAPLLLLLAGIAVLSATRGEFAASRHPVVFAAALGAVLNPVIRGCGAAVTGANAFYLRDFYIELPLVTAAAGLVVVAWRAATEGWQRRLVMAAGVLAVLIGPAVWGMPATIHRARPTPIEGIRAAGRFVAQATTPEDRIFAIEDPHIFLEAGRELLPMLTHHLFLYRPLPTERLRGTTAFNLEMLVGALRREATVAVVTERGMKWTRENERTQEGLAIVRAVAEELAAHWQLVASQSNSFAGRISIYRRRGGGAGDLGGPG